jgi:hypothetical protein
LAKASPIPLDAPVIQITFPEYSFSEFKRSNYKAVKLNYIITLYFKHKL